MPTTLIPKFAPGFRLSWRDAIVLVVGIGGAITFQKTFWPASLIIAVAIGHFFLFCNVFRISRRLELVLAGIFIVLSGATILAGFPGWVATIAMSICATVAVVICETKKTFVSRHWLAENQSAFEELVGFISRG